MKGDLDAGGDDPQDSAGTHGFLDILRDPGLLRPDRREQGAQSDLRDLAEGKPLSVAAFSREKGWFRQGRLLIGLTAPDPIVWQPYRPLRGHGEGTPLVAPFDVQEVGPVTGRGSWNVDKGQFLLLTLYADGRLWELAVPKTDIPLVRKALGSVRR